MVAFIESISKAQLGNLLVCEEQHNVGGTIPHENGHAPWQDSAIEASEPISLDDVFGSLEVAISNSLRLCLSQVFEHLEWPDEPVGEHCCGA